MRESLLDLAAEILSLLLYGVSATVLAILGTIFEYRSYLFVSTGEQFLAVWMGALGLVMLSLAYLVGRDKAGSAYLELRRP